MNGGLKINSWQAEQIRNLATEYADCAASAERVKYMSARWWKCDEERSQAWKRLADYLDSITYKAD